MVSTIQYSLNIMAITIINRLLAVRVVCNVKELCTMRPGEIEFECSRMLKAGWNLKFNGSIFNLGYHIASIKYLHLFIKSNVRLSS